MTPNPFLKTLGFSDSDRLVIIHLDDIGMCHASVQAFQDLWAFGTITSGAVMVPCPWFPSVAQLCRADPSIDMGVHITLNSEWENYRWGPLSTRDPASGLLDPDGYFHQWHEQVFACAKPEAVEREVEAQVERALASGIDVTHIDTHMGTIMSPLFIQSYLEAGARRELPNMMPCTDAMGLHLLATSMKDLDVYEPIIEQLEERGMLTLNGLLAMPLDEPDEQIQMEQAKELLGNLPPGMTHFLLHASIDTVELRSIAPDWESRVANYNVFMSDELKMFIEKEDIRLIGYRPIRQAMRKA